MPQFEWYRGYCCYSSQNDRAKRGVLGRFLFCIERNDRMSNQNPATQLMEVANRIRDMRELLGYSMQKMAELTEVSEDTYKLYETGTTDLP